MVTTSQDVPPWHSAPVSAGSAPFALKPEKQPDPGFHPFGEDGFSFLDLIDVINPLQHIPVIGPMYRDFTGDTIGPLPRIAGSTLFFGPIGAGLAAADVVLEETTGKDTGAHVLAILREESTTQTAETAGSAAQVASVVGAAGTDGDDAVSAWLQAETAYRKQLAADQNPAAVTTPPPAAAGTDGPGTVTAWAQAEIAYRAAIAPQRPAAPFTAAAGGADEPARAVSPATQSSGAPTHQTAAVPPGATAAGGGWFTDVMLSALTRYETQKDDGDDASQTNQRRLN